MKRAFHPLSDSALGFSQPPSGFRIAKFHGLISCRNRSWTTSLQSVPLVKIAHPFRGRWLPCSYPPCHRNAPPTTLLPTVSPTPALLTQSPGSPVRYRLPFDGSEGPLPGRPRSTVTGSLPTPASPAPKLYSLHESVRTVPSKLEPSGRYSLEFLPL